MSHSIRAAHARPAVGKGLAIVRETVGGDKQKDSGLFYGVAVYRAVRRVCGLQGLKPRLVRPLVSELKLRPPEEHIPTLRGHSDPEGHVLRGIG